MFNAIHHGVCQCLKEKRFKLSGWLVAFHFHVNFDDVFMHVCISRLQSENHFFFVKKNTGLLSSLDKVSIEPVEVKRL